MVNADNALTPTREFQNEPIKKIAFLDLRSALLITSVVALVIFSFYRNWNQPSLGDRANWDYFSQVVARGGVPYRDVVNIKSPISAYIGAVAILITRPLKIRDVQAIRFGFLLLAVLVVSATLLVTASYERDVGIGLVAGAIVLCFDTFVRLYDAGVQPKTPMVLFGLLTLWAISRDKPILAGFSGMLSALSWQPGLLFVGVATLAFSNYLTSWRDLKALKVLGAALVPLVLLLAYFLAVGALRDFYLWNIHFNATVYGPNELRTFTGSIRRLSRIIDGDFNAGKIFFYAAVPGLLIVIGRELNRARVLGLRHLVSSAPKHSVAVSTIAYFGFCMVDMQGGADLIPLLPFVAIFAAIFIVFLLDLVIRLIARAVASIPTQTAASAGRIAICLLIATAAFARAFSYRLPFPTLKDQDAEVSEIVANIGPNDRIFVHGPTEVLVLSGLPNASKYFLLDRGKDLYLDAVEPGGFDGWLDRLKSESPKVVLLDRLARVERRNSFFQWVREDYEEHQGRLFSYYVRRAKD